MKSLVTLVASLATMLASTARADHAAVVGSDQDDGLVLECSTIDPTFTPYYKISAFQTDPTDPETVDVLIEVTTRDDSGDLVEDSDWREGTLRIQGTQLRLTFDGGSVRGREGQTGIIVGRLSVDQDRGLEATCEVIVHAQPVGTIRN